MGNQRTLISLVIAGLFASTTEALYAGTCAMCRQTLAMSGGAGLIKGFYWSILLIAGMPLLLSCAGVLYFRRLRRRHCAQHIDSREKENANELC